jgi:hypothetical protein
MVKDLQSSICSLHVHHQEVDMIIVVLPGKISSLLRPQQQRHLCYHSKSHSQTENESKLGKMEIKRLDWFCGSKKRKQGRERTVSCCKSMMDHWAMESRKHPAH